MKRKRISIIIQHSYFVLFPFILVLIINLIEVFSNKQYGLFFKFCFLIISPLILCGVYFFVKYLIKRNPEIEFDQKAIYMAKKSIPLKNIFCLKLTATYFLNRHKIKVDYLNKKQKKSSFTFFPRFLYHNLKDLVNQIETQNPNAKLQKIFKGPMLVEIIKD